MRAAAVMEKTYAGVPLFLLGLAALSTCALAGSSEARPINAVSAVLAVLVALWAPVDET